MWKKADGRNAAQACMLHMLSGFICFLRKAFSGTRLLIGESCSTEIPVTILSPLYTVSDNSTNYILYVVYNMYCVHHMYINIYYTYIFLLYVFIYVLLLLLLFSLFPVPSPNMSVARLI